MSTSLVLLHGFTHTGASWDRVRAKLGERYLSVALDIRGHGSAAAVEPVNLAGVLADVDAVAPERFSLIGYSMGGRIALHAALAMPDRVGHLVLIGASPGLAAERERERRRQEDEALADRIERMSIEEFASRWATTPLLAGLPEDVSAEVHTDRLRNSVAGLARALRGLGTGALPSLWGRLAEVTMPVTLLVGERDTKFRELAGVMEAELPLARCVVAAGAGHAVHLESPARVAEVVASFGCPAEISSPDTSREVRRRDPVRTEWRSAPPRREADSGDR